MNKPAAPSAGPICAACKNPIKSGGLTAGNSPYHKECFCCSKCQAPLQKSFFLKDSKIVCEKCAQATGKQPTTVPKQAASEEGTTYTLADLENLALYLKQGLISQEDYDAAKKQVLERI